ncbi:unnamed protein product, partial [Rotaria magnacalcarata]
MSYKLNLKIVQHQSSNQAAFE